MSFDQIGIALFGLTAVYLSQDHRPSWRKWAPVLGIIGQPFWFYAAWKAGQWGIFGLCFLYTYSWGRGFWNQWARHWLV